MFKLIADRLGVVERLGLAGWDERSGQQGCAVQGEQLLQGVVLGHAQANCEALGVAQAAGDFFGGFEDEGVGPWRASFNEAKLLIVYAGVRGQLFEVAAQQGEVVFVVYPTNAAQGVSSGFVVQVADECVARIGGHGDDAALAQQGDGLLEQAGLRVVGVNLEKL